MNKHDRIQLNFIMSLSDEDFEDWAQQIPVEDVQYAIELIQQARTEAAIQEQELLDQLEDSDLAEANAVLKKFML
jgi:hypothetical protein